MNEKLGADTARPVLPARASAMGRTAQQNAGIGVVVDARAANVSTAHDLVFEISARRFRFDERGSITALEPLRVWRHDPGEELPGEALIYFGITRAELKGQAIDRGEAAALVRAADVRIAHGAAGIRPIIERELPGVGGLAWACSADEVDWSAAGASWSGIDGLIEKFGIEVDRRAPGGVTQAVIAILRQEVRDGCTALAELLDRARRESWLIRAFGVPKSSERLLHRRGYHWDVVRRTWWIETDDRELEEHWLAGHAYSTAGRRIPMTADIQRQDWINRHA